MSYSAADLVVLVVGGLLLAAFLYRTKIAEWARMIWQTITFHG